VPSTLSQVFVPTLGGDKLALLNKVLLRTKLSAKLLMDTKR
jgi:hypothetical protein